MAKRAASAHDNEGRNKTPSPSRHQGKVVSIKKDTKKPARQKATKTTMAGIAEPMVESPSVNGDINARIAERAYELHHHRGGHHGQDLEDWLTAEREVLSEDSF
jgi:hypothetical protein